MWFYSVIFLLCVPTALSGLLEERQPSQCAGGVQIFGVPYYGGQNLGIMEDTARDIEAAIPNSITTVIQYDSGNANRSVGIASGVAVLKQQIKQYNTACPKKPMVLLGWSQGGIVVMNLLCNSHGHGLSSRFHPNILASIAYGDETYIPGQPWSRGGCLEAGGRSVPRNDSAQCLPWKGSILDYCDKGDNFCCAGDGAVGHDQYSAKFDSNVVKFVQRRYSKFGKKKQ